LAVGLDSRRERVAQEDGGIDDVAIVPDTVAVRIRRIRGTEDIAVAGRQEGSNSRQRLPHGHCAVGDPG
jgi:hypothetical protein